MPGSHSSLDELTSSQLRKVESGDSELNANNNQDTAKEDDVDIDIYPLEQAVDTEEEDDQDEEDGDDEEEIDIYPLDQESHLGTLLSIEHAQGDKGNSPSLGQHGGQHSMEELFTRVFLGDASVTVPNLAKIIRIFINSSPSGEVQLIRDYVQGYHIIK